MNTVAADELCQTVSEMKKVKKHPVPDATLYISSPAGYMVVKERDTEHCWVLIYKMINRNNPNMIMYYIFVDVFHENDKSHEILIRELFDVDDTDLCKQLRSIYKQRESTLQDSYKVLITMSKMRKLVKKQATGDISAEDCDAFRQVLSETMVLNTVTDDMLPQLAYRAVLFDRNGNDIREFIAEHVSLRNNIPLMKELYDIAMNEELDESKGEQIIVYSLLNWKNQENCSAKKVVQY